MTIQEVIESNGPKSVERKNYTNKPRPAKRVETMVVNGKTESQKESYIMEALFNLKGLEELKLKDAMPWREMEEDVKI